MDRLEISLLREKAALVVVDDVWESGTWVLGSNGT
jgi:hypothetical protein